MVSMSDVIIMTVVGDAYMSTASSLIENMGSLEGKTLVMYHPFLLASYGEGLKT